MNTIIIEDKPQVREYIQLLVKKQPELNYIGFSDSVTGALSLIEQVNPELVLFDVELLDGTSFDVLKQIKNIDFNFIFITDHHDYATEAFRYNAIDYLLKPLEQDLFNQAIQRVLEKTKLNNQQLQINTLLNSINYPNQKKEKLLLNTLNDLHVVTIESIIRCESEDSYTYFFLDDGKKILVAKQLKDYETLLEAHGFIRVHRSHLVNINHISSFDKKNNSVVLSNSNEVPVSKRKRDILKRSLNKVNIT